MTKKSDQIAEKLKYALIYNPHAGKKRRILPNPKATDLEGIMELLEQYQIPADYFPTKYAGHATKLAQEFAKKSDYKAVLVAGGDGTVGEAANGLINTDLPLGILPLGSFMNVARMLSVPLDIEKAVMLIKIGRTRKIDVGVVTQLSGEKMDQPYYFIESAGIGLEAQLQEEVSEIEKGHFKSFFQVFKTLFDFYGYPGRIKIDDKEIQTRATLVTVSNGPFTGAGIPIAPDAKLNDHYLTVSLFKMSKWELFNLVIQMRNKSKRKNTKKVDTYQGKEVSIETNITRMVHADGRLFGHTPAKFTILPNALTLISGFPEPGESSLEKRTFLDP